MEERTVLYQKDMTLEDLSRVWFRGKLEDGTIDNINVKDASDAQFDAWARTRIIIVDDGIFPVVWSQEERLDVCQRLWKIGALRMSS